jgi:hypothetical protein
MAHGDIKYFTGLDLGQAAEFTGLAVLERTTGPDAEQPGRTQKRYAVRHLERFPLGTPFPEIGARLADMFSAPPLAHSTLMVDQTAVGQPVLNSLRRRRLRAPIRPVTITAGDQSAIDDRGYGRRPRRNW